LQAIDDALTVFHIHYGKLSLKIYSKGEVHNAADTPWRRQLSECKAFKKRSRTSRIQATVFGKHLVEACFIADETWEQMPAPSVVGNTRVGGVDFNRVRMRLAIQAVLALSTSPKGFTAGELAGEVRRWGGSPGNAYSTRQAAYDIRKLRGKQMIEKRPHSHRYQAVPDGLRANGRRGALNGTRSPDRCWQPKAVPGEAVHPDAELRSTSVTPRSSVRCVACSRNSASQHEIGQTF